MGTETQSNGSAPSEPQGTGTSEEANKEALTEERVSEMINRAVSGRFKDYEKKSAKQLEEFGTGLFTKIGSTLEEKLAALKPQAQSATGVESKTAATAAPAELPKLEDNPEFQKLLKAHKDLERQARKDQEARAAAEAKQRDASLRTTVTDALTKNGIGDALKARMAANYLIDSQKSVGWDEERIVFKGEDETLDLDAGLKAWLQTDEGKHFVPARGSAGSGERPGGGRPPAGGPQSPTAIWDALGAAIAASR